MALHPDEEIYATAIQGLKPAYTCAAAALGSTLRNLDDTRRRVALVDNVSTSIVATLVLANWTVVRIEDVTGPEFKMARFYQPVYAVKLALFALPVQRLVYFDADHLPVLSETAAAKLKALWRLQGGDPVAASETFDTRCNPRRCFNSGFMLVRPSPAAYEQVIRSRQVLTFHGQRCHFLPGDQPILNVVFRNFTPVPRDVWDVLDPWTVKVCGRSSAACRTLASTRGKPPDSWHFVGRARKPWNRDSFTAFATPAAPRCAWHPLRKGNSLAALASKQWWDAYGGLGLQGACSDINVL